MIVTSSDGTNLNVVDAGPTGAPVILAVHGYPDDHSIWGEVTQRLSSHFRVVCFDVRGAGASDHPRDRGAYALEHLVDDLHAVSDAVSPDAPVHLLGHDWGAVQCWHAVCLPGAELRFASFTSIGGAHLDHIARWLRRPGAGRLRQLAHGSYVLLFLIPALPELLWSSGLARRVLRRSEGRGVSVAFSTDDAVRGLALYRANVAQHLFHPGPAPVNRVPTQVLAPRDDAYLTEALQLSSPGQNIVHRSINARHWAPRTHPEVIARCVEELVSGDPRRLPLAVVTGAGSGIGRETAKAFAAKGHRVVVCDIDERAAAATAALIGSAFYPLDVADDQAVQAFAKQVLVEHGVPDVLVNNAGIGMAGGFLDTEQHDWDRIIDINLRGVINGCRAFLPAMVERGLGGKVVNLASLLGYTPSRDTPAYATTKAAVLMLSQCLSAEFAEHGIGVSAICPGVINTNIIRATRFLGRSSEQESAEQERVDNLYARRHYTPDKVARRIVRAVERGRVIVPVTTESHIAWTLSRVSPALLRNLAGRRLLR